MFYRMTHIDRGFWTFNEDPNDKKRSFAII